MRTIVVFSFLLFISSAAFGQTNENFALIEGDDKTSVFTFNTKNPIPKRAAFYSALLPGMGQVYNKQYWKLGIVAGGLATAGYFIQTNGRQYKEYRTAYIQKLNNDTASIKDEYKTLNSADLNAQQNQYRQYLEYSVVFTTVGYALCVLDAYVAANLRSFDIDDNISLRARPCFENRQLGVALVFQFK